MDWGWGDYLVQWLKHLWECLHPILACLGLSCGSALISVPADTHSEEASNTSSTWNLVHVGGLGCVLGSWLSPGPVLAVVGI